MLIKDSRPVLALIIQGNNFEGLADTGADVSVISSQQWPQDWEKEKKPFNADGIGLHCRCLEEYPSLQCQFRNGRSVFVTFYIVNIPINI